MEKISLTTAANTGHFAALPAQVGTLFFAAGTVLPPTSHAQDEISFIHSGVLRAVSGGQAATLRGGDVSFIPAGEVHQAEVLEDVTLSYVLLERTLDSSAS
ncbi:cupin domain-containing protein (plasmid) [Deinococcus psychrotolerans]|uniref:Cupin domain-containing protein n=1 Tax=Deinococcus psychrotolerans TaxID=2489213 RepID=A0A3G8YJ12_9DEIO|nr:cupin domain-containing protein [Deinococcus psychrotolerans]AZI44740.1 cupin domain-containing protein [Deinococcus psychrotolerans]